MMREGGERDEREKLNVDIIIKIIKKTEWNMGKQKEKKKKCTFIYRWWRRAGQLKKIISFCPKISL